jgi:hypothetical protein
VRSSAARTSLGGLRHVTTPRRHQRPWSVQLTLDPTLDLLQTWTQPISSAPPQIGETWNVLDLVADSTGFDTDDKTNYDVVYRGTLVGYQQEIVPPGQNLIIDVALRLGSFVDNAEVSADFATGEFYVMSPLVSLTIVYPAIVVGTRQ